MLADAGTIYVAATSMASNGYNIDADRIAVVTLAGATLSYGDSTTGNTDNNTGELDVNHRLILASGQQKFLWIEGNLDANGTVTATGSLRSTSRAVRSSSERSSRRDSQRSSASVITSYSIHYTKLYETVSALEVHVVQIQARPAISVTPRR